MQIIEVVNDSSDKDSISSENSQALRKHLTNRIQELDREIGELTSQALSRQNGLMKRPCTQDPPFSKHYLEYCGKNHQELRIWIRTLEDEHKLYPDIFTTDARRVYFASRAIKYGSQPYERWAEKREQIESLNEISWTEFQDVLYDALKSNEPRRAQAYYDHQEAKWDPKRQSIRQFYEELMDHEAYFSSPMDDTYLYYHFWRQVPEKYRVMLVGVNRPKTRYDIVQMIEEIEIFRSGSARQVKQKRRGRTRAPRTRPDCLPRRNITVTGTVQKPRRPPKRKAPRRNRTGRPHLA